ncbi:hypothetical protein CkaCkLH20_11602 [Colletotrichum karsti]|uniref:Uncharacterized protein n=1 Tax=Colletotrichum karsti TaxID=1095194 RepID=A0A9P6LFU1_9PEZI|nr:uncharacterized protein CkaCkLH20_11602 [Colletotrichum karsti]KAF9870930.1 hypothetical protein CkaCkLH20_11602 [Colletotrichum karsti]
MADQTPTVSLFLYDHLGQKENIYQAVYGSRNPPDDVRSNHQFKAATYFAESDMLVGKIFGALHNREARGTPVYGRMITGLKQGEVRKLWRERYKQRGYEIFEVDVYTLCMHGSEKMYEAWVFLPLEPPEQPRHQDGSPNITAAEGQQQ